MDSPKKTIKTHFILVGVVALAIVLLAACGAKSVEVTRIVQVPQIETVEVTRLVMVTQEVTRIVEKENVGAVLEKPTATPKPISNQQKTYGISDIVKLVDRTVTVNNAEVVGGILILNISVEYAGSEPIYLKANDFTAKDSEATKLEQYFNDCETSLYGDIAPGGKMRGNLCWSGASGDTFTIQLSFPFGNKTVVAVWALTVKEKEVTPSGLITHEIGEMVQLVDRKITLNSVKLDGSILIGNFTIENLGSEPLYVNPAEFDAKDSQGMLLESEYDCSQQFRGNITPGDNMGGNLCWSGAVGKTFKFQYSVNIAGKTNIVVWTFTIN